MCQFWSKDFYTGKRQDKSLHLVRMMIYSFFQSTKKMTVVIITGKTCISLCFIDQCWIRASSDIIIKFRLFFSLNNWLGFVIPASMRDGDLTFVCGVPSLMLLADKIVSKIYFFSLFFVLSRTLRFSIPHKIRHDFEDIYSSLYAARSVIKG